MAKNNETAPSLHIMEQVSNLPSLDFKETELVYEKYYPYTRQRLSEGSKVSCDLVDSKITDLSLSEVISARKAYCYFHHSDHPCKECKRITCIAYDIIEKGVVPVSVLYRKHIKSLYEADKAVWVMM